MTRRECYQRAHAFLAETDGQGLGEFLFQFELEVLRELAEPNPETWAMLNEACDEVDPSR